MDVPVLPFSMDGALLPTLHSHASSNMGDHFYAPFKGRPCSRVLRTIAGLVFRVNVMPPCVGTNIVCIHVLITVFRATA